jgi:hypothetical protein
MQRPLQLQAGVAWQGPVRTFSAAAVGTASWPSPGAQGRFSMLTLRGCGRESQASRGLDPTLPRSPASCRRPAATLVRSCALLGSCLGLMDARERCGSEGGGPGTRARVAAAARAAKPPDRACGDQSAALRLRVRGCEGDGE